MKTSRAFSLFIFSIFLLLTLSSCNIFGNQEESELLTTNGIDAIGHGYDVFDPYADPSKIKASVININAMIEDGLITKPQIDRSEFSTFSGSTYEEYYTEFHQNCSIDGSYNFYSGSVDQSFDSSRFASTAYNFATVRSEIKKYGLYIDERKNNIETLKSYLTEDFRRDIAASENDPDEFFRVYGTHLLTGIVVGARMDYNYSAKKETNSGSESIALSAKASYKSLFASASISVDVSSNTEWENWYSNEETRTMVIGGNSEYGQGIHNDGEYQGWIDSINSNPAFAFVADGGIIPLYELAETAESRTALLNAYETYGEGKSATIIPTPEAQRCIIDFLIHARGDDNAPVTIDENNRTYYRIYQDLNEGADGDYLYLYVAYGLDDGSSGLVPITDIGIAYDGDYSDAVNDADANGWMRYGTDLNQDAGGDYIYLCIKRDAAGTPVTNIYSYNYSDSDNQYPYNHNPSGFTYSTVKRVQYDNLTNTDADLNKQAGGDYIYLKYSTTAWP